jgi:hypothetical protein
MIHCLSCHGEGNTQAAPGDKRGFGIRDLAAASALRLDAPAMELARFFELGRRA